MTIPSVHIIETALGLLRSRTPHDLNSQLRELNSLGNERADYISSYLEKTCIGKAIRDEKGIEDTISPFGVGYLLGLETARAMLANLPDAVKAGVTL